MRLETSILKNLIFSEEYTRKVLPFIQSEYFTDNKDKTLFIFVSQFVNKYKTLPTYESLVIELNDSKKLTEQELKNTLGLLDDINQSKNEPTEIQWLIEQTEKFCQDKAIYNAIMESVTILDSKNTNKDKGEIPKLLSNALGVSFDSHIGHDYINDYDSRFEFYHRQETKIPFDLDLFNTITKGGLPNKTLNICLAGCVHPETKIKIRYRKHKNNWTTKEVEIKEVESLLNSGFIVEVESPDGFVSISRFVDKGLWNEYRLS